MLQKILLVEMEYYIQKSDLKKGLTLLWPAEWTHAHKGNLLKADSKYIITGWMHFPNNPNSL